jgi:hypothetical protein
MNAKQNIARKQKPAANDMRSKVVFGEQISQRAGFFAPFAEK